MNLLCLNFLSSSKSDYNNCEELPLWNFQKFLETNDLKYFSKKLKYHKGLDEICTNIFNEYLLLTENKKVLNRFSKIYKLQKLEGKYNTVILILKALLSYDNKNIDKFNELVNELNKWGYSISKQSDVFEQLENIGQRVKNLKTQIEVIQNELKEDNKEESQSIESLLLSVSRVLELRYKLDAKEISVKEWIELQKQANEQSNRLNRK